MRPRELLDLADELTGGIGEVHWRAAAGRAYYAAFHIARRPLSQCGFEVPRADQAHSFLVLRLSQSGHPDFAQAGVNLDTMRRLRNWADYDLDQFFFHSSAVNQVMMAEDSVELLEEVEATPSVLAQITAVIRVFERDVLRRVTWRPTTP